MSRARGQIGMRDERVPNDRLERLDQRRPQVGRRVEKDCDVRELRKRAAWRTDHSVDGAPELSATLQRAHYIDRYPMLARTTADRKDEKRIALGQPGDLEPAAKRRLPTVVVDPRGQLRDVLCDRVTLDRTQLAEVVDCVRRMPCSTSDSEDEQPATALAQFRQTSSHSIDSVRVNASRKRRGSHEIPFDVP